MKKILACALAALTLSGCTTLNFGVETLLAAPKLTNEQAAIHEALISAVGNNLTLKYPKNGSNRSAYVVANIDGEPGDEALVFYEYTGSDTRDDGLRVNLLDKNDEGKWVSVKEIAGAGTDVDKVILTRMGGDSGLSVLVGYQTLSGDDKALEIYRYRSGEFTRIGTTNYSVLETLDINSDGSNELVAIRKLTNTETGQVSSKAALLEMNPEGEVVMSQSIDMCDNVTSYVKAKVGKLADGRRALYVDSLNSDGALQTELIYYRYSALQNPMQLRSEKLLPLCTRPAGYYSADVDGDGIIEIPSTSPMIGYENAVVEEQVLLTTWSQYKDFYELNEKYSGYYAVSDGYSMMFPKRWKDLVTVKKDTASGEAVFYKYAGDVNAEMTELMRIAVAPKQQSQSYLYDGYQLITSAGQLDYLVKLPTNKREQLILTRAEVESNFCVIDQ